MQRRHCRKTNCKDTVTTMALLSDWWLLDLVVVGAGLLVALYLYMSTVFSYWKKRGVPYLEPSFPLGNLGEVMIVKKQFGLVFADFYSRLNGHKVGGVFQMHRPGLILRDLDVIKSFLVKDFVHFQDRGIHLDEENDPISAHLFLLKGQRWKNLRAQLTPTFTSGKMKMMFETVLECGQELNECVRGQIAIADTIEIHDTVARYTTDVIASCAFGIQCNCLKNPGAEFRVMGREAHKPGLLAAIGLFLAFLVPSIAAPLGLGRVPKNISDFFRNAVKETVEYREKNNVIRNDFMQLMIQLKNKGYVDGDGSEDATHTGTETGTKKKLNLDEISAQAFIFFMAGFDTSSATVTFCLYELALNPDIQTRLREEVDTVLARHGGQLTYEAMQEMEYLAMVVGETLRKHPPAPILNRECNSAYTMSDTGLVVEPGTPVIVSVYGLHHDPRYYPDPERFDPERFTPEQKSLRNQYSYLPFGVGPRNCIGMRFGYMQTKIALISLLSRYEFRVSEKTIIPLAYVVNDFTLAPQGGMFLKVVNRT